MPIQVLPDGRYLPEREGHRVWWCETGLPGGVPVLVLHGGPGGRTRLAPFLWFHGLPVRCIAFDQRGCGQSLPAGRLQHNTLAHLVEDIERLRVELGLAAWGVVAGSWGALLAVAYAAAHPQRVTGLFLRSAFLGSDAEVAHFFEPWAAWLGDRGAAWLGGTAAADPVALLARGLAQAEGLAVTPSLPATLATTLSLARVGFAWQAFEAAQARPGGLRAVPGARFGPPEPAASAPGTEPDALPSSLAVQLHYLRQHCFVEAGRVDTWLQALQAALAACPVALVHGRADAVCHPETTVALSAHWPHATVRWADGAGHDMDAPALRAALVSAANEWAIALLASQQGALVGVLPGAQP